LASRLADGSIQLNDGRVLYANSVLLAADLLEILPLVTPPPAWPFISGGGGGGSGGSGTPGARGADGAAGAQGPQGPGIGNPGPQGNQGNQGTAGTAGTNGTQGNQGPTGSGAQGNQGNQGTAGTTGTTGTQGAQGPTGSGAQGNQGNQGTAGSTGTTGAQGAQGSTGTTGTTGAQGNQGNSGPQGNQGIAGTGTQGPQGNQGNQGITGTSGTNGTQGNQGFQGTGVQGLQGPQGGGAGSDVYAATRVVSAAGDGTDLTVAAAITNLPAEGGRIYVKQGTYSLAATNNLPDKPVDIIGSGDGTVFDLGANAIAAFTIQDILTERRAYTFQNFKVIGNGVASQQIVDIADSNFFAVTTIKRVNSEDVKFPVDITGSGFSSTEATQVDIEDCWFVPVAAGDGALCQNSGFSSSVSVTCRNVNFYDQNDNTIGGTINNDNFSSLDIVFYDCNISYTGEDGLNTIRAENSRIFNYLGQDVATNANSIFLGGLGVDDDNIHPSCSFVNCNVVGMSWIFGEQVTATGGWWDSTTISAEVTNGKCTFDGVVFRTASDVPQFPHFGATPTAFIRDGGELNIIGCRFTNPGNLVERYIEAADSMYIAYCAFASMAAGATHCGIHVTGPNNLIVGCDFDSLWAAPPVKEEGVNAIANVYADCIGLNGNGGTASVYQATPSLVSPTTFNGSALFSATGNTTDAFVTVKMTLSGLGTSDPGTRVNPSGLIGNGTIKNTGANSMEVRETVTDAFGTTSSATTTVTAGNDLLLSMAVNINTARPPYVSYMIEVKSTTPGNATSYNYKHAMNSDVTW